MTPTAKFKIGETDGLVIAGSSDRVSLQFWFGATNYFAMTLNPTEARAMANALYEMADASEKVLPVKPDATVAA